MIVTVLYRDMSPKQKFADMLAAVGNVDGVERVRFLTSHPKSVRSIESDVFIQLIGYNKIGTCQQE